MNRRAFTLIESIVVVLIVVLLLFVVLPVYAFFGNETRNRTMCASHLAGIYKALYTYSTVNKDKFSIAAKQTYEGNATGFKEGDRATGKGAKLDNNITASLWIMVREGYVGTKSYVCPSAGDKHDPLTTDGTPNGRAALLENTFDFINADALSYSSINFFSKHGAGQWDADVNPAWVIMGDDNNNDHTADPSTRHTLSMQPNASAEEIAKNENSYNHFGEGQNLLYGDSHVSFERDPFQGPTRDNVFAMRKDDGNDPDPRKAVHAPPTLSNTYTPGTYTRKTDVVLIPVTGNNGVSLSGKKSTLSEPELDARAQAPLTTTEKLLSQGKLAEAAQALEKKLAADARDDNARFELGAVQFIQAVEHLGQSLYRYGIMSGTPLARSMPMLRLPVPPNPNPQAISYADFRKIFQTWVDDLAKAEQTLSQIKAADVEMPLRLALTSLDFNADGKADEGEALWSIFAGLNPGALRNADTERIKKHAEAFVITFDRGDVHWLRGYCHLLSAFGEVALAHDTSMLFGKTGPMLFPKVTSDIKPLATGAMGRTGMGDMGTILDMIAFVHLVNLDVSEPKRMGAALGHLEACIEQSVESWKHILTETDDDHEWIPNPRQKNSVTRMTVSQDQVQGWMTFLGEARDILAGKKLVPFWRGDMAGGINLRKVFTEPTTFDIVLWVQGSAAQPYLEAGPVTDSRTWRQLQRVFGGNFLTYAIWFN